MWQISTQTRTLQTQKALRYPMKSCADMLQIECDQSKLYINENGLAKKANRAIDSC